MTNNSKARFAPKRLEKSAQLDRAHSGAHESAAPETSAAQADVRADIARELHDGVVQDVWYLHAELASLSTNLDKDQQDVLATLEKLRKIAEGTYQDLRDLLKSLRAPSGHSIDLIAELLDVIERFGSTVDMQVGVYSDFEVGSMQLAHDTARQIIRLVQEALWNSWRHSLSKSATVGVRRTDIGIVITVSDNGCGFHPEQIDENHYGLRNMRERAALVNGKLYVTSKEGEGTTVALHVPITPKNLN